MFRRFEPGFRRRSGYSQSCRNLVHVPHFGLTRSHFNFRFRHDTQDMVFSVVVAGGFSSAAGGGGGFCWAAAP
jgi:hypothetical protein